MTPTRVTLSAKARQDLRQATAWYRKEGGSGLAQRWVAAVQGALRHIGSYPKAGSTPYAAELNLDGLRCWPVKGFPYLVFFVERARHVEVGRVLHAHRGIPAWLQQG